MFVRCLDHFVVPHGAAGLDNGGDTSLSCGINAVAKGEESVRCHDRALDIKPFVSRLDSRDFRAVHAAHLARTNSDGHIIFAENDGIRLNVLHDGPGEEHVLNLFSRRG